MPDLCRFLDAPGEISTLSADERATLAAKVALLATALASCRSNAEPVPVTAEPAPDSLLTAGEVAARFRRSVDWVYRKAANDRSWDAFTIREGPKTVRFSEQRLARYLNGRKR